MFEHGIAVFDRRSHVGPLCRSAGQKAKAGPIKWGFSGKSRGRGWFSRLTCEVFCRVFGALSALHTRVLGDARSTAPMAPDSPSGLTSWRRTGLEVSFRNGSWAEERHTAALCSFEWVTVLVCNSTWGKSEQEQALLNAHLSYGRNKTTQVRGTGQLSQDVSLPNHPDLETPSWPHQELLPSHHHSFCRQDIFASSPTVGVKDYHLQMSQNTTIKLSSRDNSSCHLPSMFWYCQQINTLAQTLHWDRPCSPD